MIQSMAFARRGSEDAHVCAELISDPESKSATLEIADQHERIARRTEEAMRSSKKPTAPSGGGLGALA
jgi:hypothetical protein